MKDCPFCHLEIVAEQKVVAENGHCRFLQTPQEVLIGSGLIVPIQHRQTVFDLTEAEWNATYSLLQEVKELLDEAYHPEGYTIGWNCQPTGGQHIMHAHLHIIPRFADEPYAGKGIRHWLKSEGNRRQAVK
ncbi:HIT domain-containing protein [Caldibacillus lycopersici]|uniref:HIT domain-containing protein n=1 Tax=Perspicuibacillus lycopersici TaxID=1325689 RepID=A0AAE3IUK1_9BACI|nr:HIT domain-containing protein [Perspicuibacillus lycopersici]MCU9613109.1 HIT domain-containing protein [Perspicuibacillus lycopersici]